MNQGSKSQLRNRKSKSIKEPSIKNAKDDSNSKGKTPDGTVFDVPITREMLQSLMDLDEPKSYFDMVTIGILGTQIVLLLSLPRKFAQYFFLGLFIFWRLAYNVGLGWLLKYQSEKRGLVKLARRYRLFDTKDQPRLAGLIKKQLSMKMKSDYNFDSIPIEYNTWLLFRQLVDLVLMNDFASYVCFSIAWFNTSPKSSFFMDEQLRWLGGIFIILFNIWVKVDAQRVVKDFAWYWGDFFFLIEQSLTFDGVFEMAPHPMYSLGYIGYYGISLICASYTVLFVSIFAHLLQFAFLTWVETPHIDKTYNRPVIPKRQPLLNESVDEDATTLLETALASHHQTNYFRRDLIVFKNFDLFQASDLISAFVLGYAALTPFLMNAGIAYTLFQAIAWRLFHSAGLGWLLYSQSRNKFFTRHFIKWGGDVNDAFQSWKSIYNFSTCMTYVSFITLCIKLYTLPNDWTYGMTLLRHTLGVVSDFGWFYGDFFMDDQPTQLLYTGIYRFLNNPEKIIGHAAFWGFGLITNSRIIFGLALFSQIANSLFLNFVEKPHMEKLYGDKLRKEAGLTKTLKTAARKIPQNFPKAVQHELTKFSQEQIKKQDHNNQARYEPGSERVSQVTLQNSPYSDTHELNDHIDPCYSLKVSHCSHPSNSSKFVLGQRIKVDWIAPKGYRSKDCIGIYRVSDPPGQLTSRVKLSHHQPIYRNQNGSFGSEGEEEYDNDILSLQAEADTHGSFVLKGSRLPWSVGTYEIRYLDRSKVLARSITFEIVPPPTPELHDLNAIQLCLLKLVQNALDKDPEKIPMSPIDRYTLDEQAANRVAYTIKLVFNIEFAWEVILADTSVSQLTKRIVNGIDALSPFSNNSKKRNSVGAMPMPTLSSSPKSTLKPSQ